MAEKLYSNEAMFPKLSLVISDLKGEEQRPRLGEPVVEFWYSGCSDRLLTKTADKKLRPSRSRAGASSGF